MMRYEVSMFLAVALCIAGIAFCTPQDGTPDPPVVQATRPISERVALLEREGEYLATAIMQLHDELRSETTEIKDLLKEQNNHTEQWIVYILGLLIAGDRGYAIFQRTKKDKGE